MKQISCYQTLEEMLRKNLCQLVEKCYNSQLITTLIVKSESIDEIDKLLWTYSQKLFIPHGSKFDQFPEQQPIYISSEFENPNNSSTLMIFNPSEEQLLIFEKLFLSKSEQNLHNKLNKFTRTIFICSNNHTISKYKEAIKKHVAYANIVLDCFRQSSNGGWSRVD